MNTNWISPVLYALGWIIIVLLQAQNSVKSKSNGLPAGWAGIVAWLKSQTINLVFRAFVCGIFYGFVIQQTTQKMAQAGLSLHAYAVAGVSGLASCAVVYQLSGFIPYLRQEVSDFAPPANDQIVKPPTTPTPGAPS